MLRTDNFANLRVADLRADEQGRLVHLRQSKTDQYEHGVILGIAASTLVPNLASVHDEEANTM